MEKSKNKTGYQAPALEKGLDILEYLSGEREGRTLSEIAHALGRNQSELYRMMACLEDRDYIAKDEGGGFRITLRLFELGHRQHTATMLRKAAHVPMEALAEEIGQSCHLSFQHGASLIVMMERMPARRVCLSVGEGATLPMSRTASGKVLLSRMAEEAADQLLEDDPEFSRLAKAAQKQIRADIEQGRANGFLFGKSELTEGVADIAIPVGVDGSGTAAVLAVSYLDSVKDAAQKQRNYLKATLICAGEINRNLGVFG
ncbi:IclR family transcriptional regulator [Pontiella sulfatireligans]|uniref:HTH-type transcriptional repressor AllR n=1 Tax=Pontiella sulfatireligans TaxID=2750658 RepID=A0A6C2UQ04_9BACT|nr:IclR family transcriptional regulator [Pontiella sulfatireligans]VGO22013.1 HTH-type transcriptional repressor AllR [Pontiella sulfatireligans]